MKPIRIAVLILTFGSAGLAADWPHWGRDGSRNMVAPPDATGLPDTFDPGKLKDGTEEIDLATTKNVRWAARLGAQSYGNPTVAHGRVYVGTNNDNPRDERHAGDRGVVLCLDEATGKLLWQLVVPKLGGGKNVDFEGVGICSSVAALPDLVYVVTNRCEVVALDPKGLADGNAGPFTDEGQYLAGPGQPPVALGPLDADIVWRYDMYDELGIFPHNMTSSSVLVVGDRLYATTSNSRDWTKQHIPSPDAPALICLDRRTGKLLGVERSGISRRTFLSNWSSPAHARVNGRDLVIFGGGDGWCYAFEAEPVDGVLKEVWRFDCNPPQHKVRTEDGKQVPIEHDSDKGPSEIVATPVFHDGKVYVAVGQNPENGDGVGHFVCIDAAAGTGDITARGKVWSTDKVRRSMSTAAVAGGLVFISDFAGFLHCFDAGTGQHHWTHDTEGEIWGSPLVADGKVYLGNATGDVLALAASRELKVVGKSTMEGAVYSSAIVANGTLYIMTENRLYAVSKRP